MGSKKRKQKAKRRSKRRHEHHTSFYKRVQKILDILIQNSNTNPLFQASLDQCHVYKINGATIQESYADSSENDRKLIADNFLPYGCSDELPFPHLFLAFKPTLLINKEDFIESFYAKCNAELKKTILDATQILFRGIIINSYDNVGRMLCLFLVSNPSDSIGSVVTIAPFDNTTLTSWCDTDNIHWSFLCAMALRSIDNKTPLNIKSYRKLNKQPERAHNIMPPQPGYTISKSPGYGSKINNTTTRDDAEWPFSFQFDRCAHEVCRIHKGEMPINYDKKRWLEAHKYRIYYGHSIHLIPDIDQKRLERRGHQLPSENSWVGIKNTIRKETVVGKHLEELPYIPGVRQE